MKSKQLPSLVWYSGISKDQTVVQKGKGVVLSANEDICRVLTYENDKFMVRGYFSPRELNILAQDNKGRFVFANKTYLTWPCYFYCSSSKEEKLKEWYKKFCETPKDLRMETYRQTWLRNRESMSTGKCKGDSKQIKANMPLGDVIDRIEETGVFEAIFTICLVTQDSNSMGTVDLFLRIEKSPPDASLPYRVSYFDKSKVVADAKDVIENHGISIPHEDIVLFVDNILLGLSQVLKDRGIDFDINEPDDLPF